MKERSAIRQYGTNSEPYIAATFIFSHTSNFFFASTSLQSSHPSGSVLLA